MAEPDWKQITYDRTYQGVYSETARIFKQKYELLRLAATQMKPNLKPLESKDLNDDKEFHRMADEAIKTGKFRLPGTAENQSITLDALDKKLKEYPSAVAALKSMEATNLNELVPTDKQAKEIADVTANAVHDNLYNGMGSGLTGGTTITNAAKGAIGYVWSGGSKTTTQTVAENISTYVGDKIAKLKAEKPEMKAILNKENTDFIKTSVKSSVIDREAPPEDRVASTSIEPIDDAMRTTISNAIYNKTFYDTQQAINAEVENGYTTAGFMGSIAKMVGPGIANMLISVLNFFITMFGGTGYDYIPQEEEIHNAATVVAKSVSKVLTEGNPPQTAADAAEAVKKHVQESLTNDKAHYPSFSPKQIEEMATKAGAAVEKSFKDIPKLPGKSPDKKTEQAPDKKMSAALNQYHEGYNPASKATDPVAPLVPNELQNGLVRA